VATVYRTRRKCGYEDDGSSPGDYGNGKGWHYIEEDQTTIEEGADCPTHPAPATQLISDFVVLPPEEET